MCTGYSMIKHSHALSGIEEWSGCVPATRGAQHQHRLSLCNLGAVHERDVTGAVRHGERRRLSQVNTPWTGARLSVCQIIPTRVSFIRENLLVRKGSTEVIV